MVETRSPFDGGFSAELVIDDKVRSLAKIVRSFQSVVCVAAFDEAVGQLKFQLVYAQHRLIAERLHHGEVICIALPLFVCGGKDYMPTSTAP